MPHQPLAARSDPGGRVKELLAPLAWQSGQAGRAGLPMFLSGLILKGLNGSFGQFFCRVPCTLGSVDGAVEMACEVFRRRFRMLAHEDPRPEGAATLTTETH